MPSSLNTPEAAHAAFADDEFLPLAIAGVGDRLIYLPKKAIQHAPSLLREALRNEEARTRGIVKLDDVDGWVEGKATSVEALDVVFGCLIYGFVDVTAVKRVRKGLQKYHDVGRDGADADDFADIDLDHIIDSIILADAVGAAQVAGLLVQILREEFACTNPSLKQIERLLSVPWAMNTFLYFWMFGFDDAGKKSQDALRQHRLRVSEAVQKFKPLADLAKHYMAVWEMPREAENTARTALGMELLEEVVVLKKSRKPPSKLMVKKAKNTDSSKKRKLSLAGSKALKSRSAALESTRTSHKQLAKVGKRQNPSNTAINDRLTTLKSALNTKLPGPYPSPHHQSGNREWATGKRRPVKKPARFMQ